MSYLLRGAGKPGGGLPNGTINGQITWFKSATGLWVPSTTGPSATGQVPTWNGTEYDFENPRTYLFGASNTGNTNLQRFLNPGIGPWSAPFANVIPQTSEIVAGRAGVITNYDYRFRNSVGLQDTLVSLWINAVQVASFIITAGTVSKSGTWVGGPFSYNRGDRIAIGTLTAVADAAVTSGPAIAIG